MRAPENLLETDFSSHFCVLLLNGEALSPHYQVITLEVRQGFQEISMAKISFKQTVDLMDQAPLAGEELQVIARKDGEDILLFDGYIVKHEYKTSNQGTRLTITAKTLAVNMALTTHTEVFSMQRDLDLLESLVQKHGLTFHADESANKQLQLKSTQLVKHQCSDWDFINLRAEANGCLVYTEGNEVKVSQPRMVPNAREHLLIKYGKNVYQLSMEQDERIAQVVEENHYFDLSSLDSLRIPEEATALTGKVVKGIKSNTSNQSMNEQASLQAWEGSQALRGFAMTNGQAHIHAQLLVKPGDGLRLEGFNEIMNNSYLITAVEQQYDGGGFSTRLQFGLKYPSFTSRYPMDPSVKQKPLVLSGIVQQLEDDPDHLNRILVRIPLWKEAQEPLWARLATAYAGKDHGLVLLPEIGDEVLVSFMGDDFDAPLVIGSVFNPVTPPPITFQDKNVEKTLVAKNGMKWRWDDEKGIHEIATPNGNKIVISADTKSILIEDEHKNKISMDGTAICLESPLDVKIIASKNISMEAVNIELKATGISKIKGTMVQIN